MRAFKRILCPTDFSEPSYVALREAVDLARHFGADLYVVHVTRPSPMVVATAVTDPPLVMAPTTISEHQQQVLLATEAELRQVVSVMVPDDVPAHPVVEVGDPARRIASLAEERHVDLIVMATHGQTGWRRFVSGSVAEKVVRYSTMPVLTIRQPR